MVHGCERLEEKVVTFEKLFAVPEGGGCRLMSK